MQYTTYKIILWWLCWKICLESEQTWLERHKETIRTLGSLATMIMLVLFVYLNFLRPHAPPLPPAEVKVSVQVACHN